ncbi:MAG: hypothetical protein FDZ75_08370, partial [Actinobacteria bacterium]
MIKVSARSWVLFGIAMLGALAMGLVGWLRPFGEAGSLVVVDWGSAVVNAFCAALVFSVAFGFKPGEAVRLPWMLMGIAVAMNAVGDAIYAYYEVVLKVDAYPSIADVPYVAEYGFLFAAIMLTTRAYRGFFDWRAPLVKAVAAALVVLAGVYLLLLRPYILPAGPDELTMMGKIVSTAYPVLDVVLVFGPVVYLAMLMSNFGKALVVWPWRMVAIGALVLAVTDSWYSYADWAG